VYLGDEVVRITEAKGSSKRKIRTQTAETLIMFAVLSSKKNANISYEAVHL
jgi:hypothetical protein